MAGPPCHANGSARGHHAAVLWIDDEPDTTLARLLALEGFSLAVAETGVAGLGLAQVRPFDVIVVDLHLPDVHGLTVVHRLRAAGIASPVLVVTGHYLEPECRPHAMRAGATALMFKPLLVEDLLPVLRDLIFAPPVLGSSDTHLRTAHSPRGVGRSRAGK